MSTGRNRWTLLACVAATLFLGACPGGPPREPPPTRWTTHSLAKVRPFDPMPARLTDSVEIWAARNEFESFQIVLHAEWQDLSGADIEVSDLTGPSTIPAK